MYWFYPLSNFLFCFFVKPLNQILHESLVRYKQGFPVFNSYELQDTAILVATDTLTPKVWNTGSSEDHLGYNLNKTWNAADKRMSKDDYCTLNSIIHDSLEICRPEP